MRFLKWTLTSLLFIIIKDCCRAQFLSRFSKQNACIGLVAIRYFRSNSTVAIFATESKEYQHPTLFSSKPAASEDGLHQLLSQSTQFSLIILKQDQNNSYCSNELSAKSAVDYYIFSGSLDDVVKYIKTFCFDQLTHDRSHFVIYLEVKTSDARNIVGNVLELLWSHQHQNVIVLVDGQKGEEIDVYTWFPLDVTPQVKIVDQCNGMAFRKQKPLLQPKAAQDLNGRVINVGLVVTPPHTCDRIGGGHAGPDISLMNSIAKTLNFTPVYIDSNNIRTNNKSSSGTLGGPRGPWKTVLQGTRSGEVSIALGGFIIWRTLLGDFGYTHPTYKDFFGFAMTSDLKLTGCTERWLWIFTFHLIVVQFCTALVMYALTRRGDMRKATFASTAMMVWSLLTDSSTNISHLSSKQMLLWGMIAFYAIHWNADYRSILTALMARLIYVEKIQTLTDMVESNLPVTFTASVDTRIEDFDYFSRDQISRLKPHLSYCSASSEHCLAKLESSPQYCWSTGLAFKQFLEVVFPHRKYHILKPLVGIAYHTIYTKKNLFLTRKMSMIVLRASQAGLLAVWKSTFLRNHKICDLSSPEWKLLQSVDAKRPPAQNYPVDFVRALNITNLYSPFRLLGCGLALAMVVLCIEILSSARVPSVIWTYFRSYFPYRKRRPQLQNK